jgi:hypothetical protein
MQGLRHSSCHCVHVQRGRGSEQDFKCHDVTSADKKLVAVIQVGYDHAEIARHFR